MKEHWNSLNGTQKAKLIFKIILIIFAIIFVIRNWQDVEVIPIFLKVQMPLTLVILFSMGVGFAVASLFDYRKFKAKNKEIEELKAKLPALEEPKNENQNK